MSKNASYRTGKQMFLGGLLLSPSILFLIYRMSEGFNGAYATGLGTMEVFLTPFYALPVIGSIILMGKGIEMMKSSK